VEVRLHQLFSARLSAVAVEVRLHQIFSARLSAVAVEVRLHQIFSARLSAVAVEVRLHQIFRRTSTATVDNLAAARVSTSASDVGGDAPPVPRTAPCVPVCGLECEQRHLDMKGLSTENQSKADLEAASRRSTMAKSVSRKRPRNESQGSAATKPRQSAKATPTCTRGQRKPRNADLFLAWVWGGRGARNAGGGSHVIGLTRFAC
jgi:hypothetical protein